MTPPLSQRSFFVAGLNLSGSRASTERGWSPKRPQIPRLEAPFPRRGFHLSGGSALHLFTNAAAKSRVTPIFNRARSTVGETIPASSSARTAGPDAMQSTLVPEDHPKKDPSIRAGPAQCVTLPVRPTARLSMIASNRNAWASHPPSADSLAAPNNVPWSEPRILCAAMLERDLRYVNQFAFSPLACIRSSHKHEI
jgi:hypothetical protein